MRVLKYPLEITDTQEISMPEGAMILSAQMQRGVLCLWALVDEKEPKVGVRIHIVGTGHPIDKGIDLIPIDTVQDGDLVWHVFEEFVDDQEEMCMVN